MRPEALALAPRERAALEAAVRALVPDASAVPGGGIELPAADGSGGAAGRLVVGFESFVGNVPAFRLSPRLPGSFLHGTLRLEPIVDGREAEGSGTPVDADPTTRAPAATGHPVEPDWHYAAMTLRPASVGRGSREGDGGGVRRVAAYPHPADTDVGRTAAGIARACTSLDGPFSLALVGSGDGPARVAARLDEAHGIGARRVPLDADDARSFFGSLAGIDLAVFETGDGRFADAIEVGVPVRVVGEPVDGIDGAPEWSPDGALRADAPDIARQRERLARALDAALDPTLVENDRRALRRALHERFAAVGTSVRLAPAQAAVPVIPRRSGGAPVPATGRLRFDGPRRKLAKFRESPARFARDSRLPLLRRLAGGDP